MNIKLRSIYVHTLHIDLLSFGTTISAEDVSFFIHFSFIQVVLSYFSILCAIYVYTEKIDTQWTNLRHRLNNVERGKWWKFHIVSFTCYITVHCYTHSIYALFSISPHFNRQSYFSCFFPNGLFFITPKMLEHPESGDCHGWKLARASRFRYYPFLAAHCYYNKQYNSGPLIISLPSSLLTVWHLDAEFL